ncbi:MAG: hypothetical protein LQ337_008684 [Flavoplaca oasis]|nr:MAG: hypothetical protein LQ337_008684 [Flavoplaca oasis]
MLLYARISTMTIHHIARADAAPTTARTEAQDKLTDLAKLVAVRKSLNGSHLPLADLDQIIAKIIEKIQQDVIAGNSSGNLSGLLGHLNGIRTDMMAICFDVINVESLMQHIIARACDEMKIDRKVPGIPQTAIPLASYTVSSLVFKSKQPERALKLVLTSPEDATFSLFEGACNLHEWNDSFGFKNDDISEVFWSESRNMIKLLRYCKDMPKAIGEILLEMMDEPSTRLFLDIMSSNRYD